MKSKSKHQLPKFVYAHTLSGEIIKIPLVPENKGQKTIILQYLLDAGVNTESLTDIFFTTTDLSSIKKPQTKSQKRSMLEVRSQSGFYPEFPKIEALDSQIPFGSAVTRVGGVALKQLGRFGMIRIGDRSTRNIFDFRKDQFVNKAQYDELHSDSLQMTVNLCWAFKDQRILGPHDESQIIEVNKVGMESNISASLSTTIGVQMGAVSATVSASLSASLTLTSERTTTVRSTSKGTPGNMTRTMVYQLMEMLRIEKKEGDTYTPLRSYKVDIKDKPDSPVWTFEVNPMFFNNQMMGIDGDGNPEAWISNVIAGTEKIEEVPTLFKVE